MSKKTLVYVFALVLWTGNAIAAGTTNSTATSICSWSPDDSALNGKRVRFTAYYGTDFTHFSHFYDPRCKSLIDVGEVPPPPDDTFIKFSQAMHADSDALRDDVAYVVDVSGVLRVIPPDPDAVYPYDFRKYGPRLLVDLEHIWGFQRLPPK